MSKNKQSQSAATSGPVLKEYKLLKDHTYRREPKKVGDKIKLRDDQVKRLSDLGVIEPNQAQ